LVASGAGEDRRSRRLRLTEAGRRKLAEAVPYWQAAQHRVEEKLGPARLAELRRLLRVLESLDDR
jgi:DNA-binding MarR family transcriptional regulator